MLRNDSALSRPFPKGKESVRKNVPGGYTTLDPGRPSAKHGNNLRFILGIVVCLVFAGQQLTLETLAQSSARPALVVLLVADQFPFNSLSRYGDKFSAGGIRMLQDRGASFTHCLFDNVSTGTAVGHSVISTGAYPWATGIVGDTWFDRRRAKEISCVLDDSLQLVGANGQGSGTHLLQGTTFGDQMKLSTNGRSKVIAVSLKDSSSLLLAGRLANNAYWFDSKSGSFVSSQQYGTQMPNWVKGFNDKHYPDQFLGKPWQRLLPETQYTASTRDDYPYESGLPGEGKQFPHVLSASQGGPTGAATGTANGSAPGSGSESFYSTFAMTPFANQMVCDFARDCVEHESMGQHIDPDLIAVSFSAGQELGDAFGRYSQEVEDLSLRLDQSIQGFLQFLDQKVGLSNCLIVFTSDHGVAPIPEFSKERGLEAGRIDPKSFKTQLDSALDQRLGPDDWIESFEPPNLYLNLNAIDKQKYRQPDVEALTAKICHSVAGVGEALSAVQFFTNQLPNGPLSEAARKSYYWGRSGELIVTTKPEFIFSAESTGTASGSPHSYDAQVPLILMGKNVRPGTYATSASPADIAPTITSILGIEAPNLCEGRALSEALSRSGDSVQATAPNLSPQPVVEPSQSQSGRRRR